MAWDNPDDPEVTVLSYKKVTARKDYTCANCQSKIPLGYEHYVSVWIDDGKLNTQRNHGPYPSCPRDIEYERLHALSEVSL